MRPGPTFEELRCMSLKKSQCEERLMLNSRREFLAGTAAAVGTRNFTSTLSGAKTKASPDAILSLFKGLPGEVAVVKETLLA